MADLDDIASVEAACFPAAEAATRAQFEQRLQHYAAHFWLIFLAEKLIGFIDGMASDETILRDEMFAQANLHNPHGAWQMIFGVNVLPQYRRCGYAAQLIQALIAAAKNQNRKGVILTCKTHMMEYYAKFGFVNEGLSQSEHGGEQWYQMRLTF